MRASRGPRETFRDVFLHHTGERVRTAFHLDQAQHHGRRDVVRQVPGGAPRAVRRPSRVIKGQRVRFDDRCAARGRRASAALRPERGSISIAVTSALRFEQRERQRAGAGADLERRRPRRRTGNAQLRDMTRCRRVF